MSRNFPVGAPYDLTKLDPIDLELLLDKRPDLRKEVFEEANNRLAHSIEIIQQSEIEYRKGECLTSLD